MVHRIYHVTMCYQNISSPTKKVMSNRRWLSFAVVATHLRSNLWTVVQISDPFQICTAMFPWYIVSYEEWWLLSLIVCTDGRSKQSVEVVSPRKGLLIGEGCWTDRCRSRWSSWPGSLAATPTHRSPVPPTPTLVDIIGYISLSDLFPLACNELHGIWYYVYVRIFYRI